MQRPPITADLAPGAMWFPASGQWIDPFNMAPSQVRICDISLALSNICRYIGQVEKHTSVAEHSVRVALSLYGHPHPQAQLAGLLHDAGEAYLGDMPNPVKRDPRNAWFRELEDRLLFDLIYPVFGVDCTPSSELWQAVKTADRLDFQQEWDHPTGGGDWSARRARQSFMEMFNHLHFAL